MSSLAKRKIKGGWPTGEHEECWISLHTNGNVDDGAIKK